MVTPFGLNGADEFCTSPHPISITNLFRQKSLFCSIKTFFLVPCCYPVEVNTRRLWIQRFFQQLWKRYSRYYGRHLSYQVAPCILPSLYYITSGPQRRKQRWQRGSNMVPLSCWLHAISERISDSLKHLSRASETIYNFWHFVGQLVKNPPAMLEA